MNNEEKILEMLLEMRSDIAELKSTQAKQGAILGRLEERVEELDERSLRSAVMLENEICPKVQLLLEGQAHLRDTLAPKNRVEALEDEMDFMKSVIKAMKQEIAELKKAQ